jgi:arylsulfatase A-like enzyme
LAAVHGFDEFYGNLYHVNAEEEPEEFDYPEDHPVFQNYAKPRGVLECRATDADDPAEDQRFGRAGKQTIKKRNNWKIHFMVKDDWFAGHSVKPTVPRPVNVRVGPFEQHMDAPGYPLYAGEKLWPDYAGGPYFKNPR